MSTTPPLGDSTTKGDSMTEQQIIMSDTTPDPAGTPLVAQVWDPLGLLPDETHPLKTSGGRASILCRKWSGRERLAYEDAMTVRFLVPTADGAVDDDGDPKQTIKTGSMRAYATALTVVGSTGFPDRDGRTFLTGTVEEREADLLAITSDAVFDEIRTIAEKVQTPPGQEPDEDKPKSDEDGVDGGDPSLTPSTQPAAAPDDAPASPAE